MCRCPDLLRFDRCRRRSGMVWRFVAQLDDGGSFGSVFRQVPADIMTEGKVVHTLIRLAVVMKKEKGESRKG